MAIGANLLVVDDDESMRLGCAQALEEEGYRVRLAATGPAGLQLATEESFDLILLDMRLPGLGGLEVLERVKQESPHTAVIVITGYPTIESAVEAMRRGAYDFLPKPFTPETLTAIVGRALERQQLALENLCLKLALSQKVGPGTIIGRSPAMTAVARLIQKAAPADATVLITGETGTGKELVARALHEQSPRRDRPFVSVDCAALVETLFESELFGHVRGAFTGAVETTAGKFELASGGTILLDEIGNIGPALQVKLLRVLQEREITKVGGSQRVKIDVRVLAATNRDLLQDTRAGLFREDLFYRLSVIPIHLPPLRERRDDIRPLALHFLERYGRRRNRRVTGFAEDALRALEAYDWPGNVRELENTVERALVMAEGPVIGSEDLFFYGSAHELACGGPLGGHLAEVERREIQAALGEFGWQMARAADFLGINRKTLREKIRRYGLERPA